MTNPKKSLGDYLYYHEDGPPTIDIYLGDCLSVMPLLPKVDLVVTDPPYGIDLDYGWKGEYSKKAFGKSEWDIDSSEIVMKVIQQAKNSIVWGGNYFPLPPKRGWLVWDKIQEHSGSEAELAWTDLDIPLKVFKLSRVEAYSTMNKQHPTQKPLSLIKWAIQQCKYWDTPLSILDPFGGSGTTAVACKELKKACTIIEINEKYCEIAKKRLQNTQVPFL